jgi:hypothetical protein
MVKFFILTYLMISFVFGQSDVVSDSLVLYKDRIYTIFVDDNVLAEDIVLNDFFIKSTFIKTAKGNKFVLSLVAEGEDEEGNKVLFPEEDFKQMQESIILNTPDRIYNFDVIYRKPRRAEQVFKDLRTKISFSEDPEKRKRDSINNRLQELCKEVYVKQQNIYNRYRYNNKVHFGLTNIYVKGNNMFFTFYVKNESVLDLDLGRFTIQTADIARGIKTNLKNAKDIESEFYTYNYMEKIKGKTDLSFVIAIKRIAIDRNKMMRVSFQEESASGGRALFMDIFSSDVLNAKQL